MKLFVNTRRVIKFTVVINVIIPTVFEFGFFPNLNVEPLRRQ